MGTEDKGSSPSGQGFDWAAVEVPDFSKPPAVESDLPPKTDHVDDSESDVEQPQPTESASTTPPVETEAPQPEGEDSGVDATSLEAIPEEYRPAVLSAIEQKYKQLQSGYTKKFQALAAERERLKSLSKYVDDSGVAPDELLKQAAAFKRLESAPGIKIMQGDKVLYEAATPAPREPDFDTMTPAEIAQHIKNEVARERELLLKEVNAKFAPIEQDRAL